MSGFGLCIYRHTCISGRRNNNTMSSHNSKYYKKKLTKGSTSSLKKIDCIFKKKFFSESTANSKQGGGDTECLPCDCRSNTESSRATSTGAESDCTIPSKRMRSETCDDHDSSSTSDDSEHFHVLVPDARRFSSLKYEQNYKWLYYSVTHEGYMCKICELFAVVIDKLVDLFKTDKKRQMAL